MPSTRIYRTNIIHITTIAKLRKLNIFCIEFKNRTRRSLQKRWYPSYMWGLVFSSKVESICLPNHFTKRKVGSIKLHITCPLFIEMNAPRLETKCSCMCVLVVSILSLFLRFSYQSLELFRLFAFHCMYAYMHIVKYTKGIMRSRTSKRDRNCNVQKIEQCSNQREYCGSIIW